MDDRILKIWPLIKFALKNIEVNLTSYYHLRSFSIIVKKEKLSLFLSNKKKLDKKRPLPVLLC